METSFYSKKELENLGIHKHGDNVLISKFARLYNPGKLEIGNNVRIDDFCILTGNIELGSYIHISAYSALYGNNGIVINNFSGLSPRTILFSSTDDFSGKHLINPMVPEKYTNVTGGEVKIGKYVQLGANTIVLPKITIKEGTTTGAFTFVNQSLDSWNIYAGIPAKKIKKRSRKLMEYAKKL